MNSFTEISPYEIAKNPIHSIGKDWMLVSAADDSDSADFGKNYNTMTASWGGVGVLWGRPVAYVFIRPERHTYSFTEKSPYMTLSFFDGERKEDLAYCGKFSGRDVDKAAKCGLTPIFESLDGGRSVYFAEASTVLCLKKMYAAPISREAFLSPVIEPYYKTDGLHQMYVCEITKVLTK